jgi:hypothetical protein
MVYCGQQILTRYSSVLRDEESMRLLLISALFLFVWIPAPVAAWPNGPDDDPRLDMPNDPGYEGQWNLWSYVPQEWAEQDGFRQDEVALGTGIHADRAWQVTTGDRRVIIAVLDSGVYWDNRDLVNKYYLNKGELSGCVPQAMEDSNDADGFDVDGNGWFDIRDYWAAAGQEDAMLTELDSNGNGMLDPQDLIISCSDGVDDDGNGYVDDISGWDFFADDNDAYDDNRFGHGNGEAKDSVAEGNNGMGDIGVCPDCTALMVRAGDSFVVDANEFGHAVLFAVDSGAHVIQEALGAVNNPPLAQQAINYAYDNNVVVIASAADELSYHHNFPGTNNHTVYVHAIMYDGASADQSTTFLNFNNCTNFGMQLLLSTPGGGCSSEATGITAGHAGLIYAAGLKANLDPPLSAEELKQILTLNVDDIDVNPTGSDPTKFVSGPGWDWHFGYGRNNARKTVDAVMEKRIPPEVDILDPLWFQVLYPDDTPTIDIEGRINIRRDGHDARYDSVDWVFEYALGVAPKDDEFVMVAEGSTEGLQGVITTWNISTLELDLEKRTEDAHQNAVTVRLRATASLEDGTPITGEMRKGFLLERDEDRHDGFPIYLGTSGESSPRFADLDGDGAEELVVALADGSLHAFTHDTSELPGFPAYLNLRLTVDPDNPTHSRNACAHREDKSECIAQVGTVSTDVRHTLMMTPAVGDLDGDGSLEIVMATWDGWIYAFEHDGSRRDGWPKSVDFTLPPPNEDNLIEFGFFSAPTLYDLDGDGSLEIIAPAMDQHIYVWHPDGSPMAPFPVKVSSDDEQGARIICTAAVGDVDADGSPDIAIGTSETFGATGNANEAVAYLLDVQGQVKDGWPQSLYGLTVDVLPIVGKGIVSNPIMADLDYDGTLEISFDTISTQGWIFNHDGSIYAKMDNKNFGDGSNSEDSPGYILMNNGAMGHVDGEGGIDFVKGTAGFDFAIAFAGGGQRKPFDHHMSAWDTDTTKMLWGFPRVHDDWQFFNTPSIVDIDNDTNPEIIVGSGGYLVHAWNYLGEEPAGWPKQTGGWIIASVAVGDFDGDQHFDVAVTTRDGWLYAWKTPGVAGQSMYEWNGFGHDPHNTNNYERSPTPYQTWENSAPSADTSPTDREQDDDTEEIDDDGEENSASSSGGGGGGCQSGHLPWALGLSLLLLLLGTIARRQLLGRHGARRL